jgi:riboflavin synthase
MFTGLVQSLGKIRTISGDRLEVNCLPPHAHLILNDLEIGDSVAVNGACLTVEEILPQGFIAAVSPETVDRTTIGHGDRVPESVNLETSLRVGSKIGGHFVTGHIDGIGMLVSAKPTATSWELKFTSPTESIDRWQQSIGRYIVSKGSVAINGISLTIADCAVDGSWFTVAVIPHTYSVTNLAALKPQDWVNVEGDILGKYVDKLISHPHVSQNSDRVTITADFLAANGY